MYEEKYQSFDKSIVGKAAVSVGVPALVYFNYPGDGSGAVWGWNLKDCRVGFLTGWWSAIGGVNYAQVELENDITFSDGEKHHFAYIIMKEYRISDIGINAGATKLVNDLIYNNKTILENNLLCAGIISKIENKGIFVDPKYKQTLATLQTKLQVRDAKIMDSNFIASKKTATPTGFNKYASNLTDIVINPGVGIAPVVIYIVVSVVITLLSTALIYLIFKPDYTDSKSDLKVSGDLTKALATLSPEARAAVLADLNGQVDKAYLDGKMDGSGSGILKTMSYVAAGFLGFTLIDKTILNKVKS